MESAVRYDFSFPPKSTSLNNNNNIHTVSSNVNTSGNTQQMSHSNPHTIFSQRNNNNYHHQNHHHHHQQQQQQYNYHNNHHQNYNNNHLSGTGNYTHSSSSLAKSASTSLLTCVSQQQQQQQNSNNNYNINNNNNNNNPKYANNNFCNSCNHNVVITATTATTPTTTAEPSSSLTTNNNNNSTYNLNDKSQNSSKSGVKNQNAAIIGAPGTPKDGNCSFTFDDLKNTLAFMEDSPQVNANNNNNTNTNSNPPAINNTNPGPNQLLMVKLDTNPQSDGSLSSSGSSSSGLSSGSSSCNSCYSHNNNQQQQQHQQQQQQQIPKSNSNPMLALSSSSSSALSGSPSNSSSNTTSPTSIGGRSSSKNCTCTSNAQYHQHQNNVLDLLVKKSTSSELDHHTNQHLNNTNTNNNNNNPNPYGRGGSSSSLITPVNNKNTLNLNSNTLLGNMSQNATTTLGPNINVAIESAAKKYRCAAQISEASCCWKGKLPPKQYKTPIVYSTKVFVGGLPWDITEEDILKEFGVFGPCRVEWTNKEKFNLLSNSQQQTSEPSFNDIGNNQVNSNPFQYQNSNQSFRRQSMGNLPNKQQQSTPNNSQQPSDMNPKHRLSPGFAYVIYESEYSVRTLVGNCIEDYQNGRDRVEYYFKISTRRVRNKEVQIIPWILADNNFALCTPKELDPKKTVFVGNLHGTMTARDLAHIMNELFGCVVYAGIDIDKLKYPIGSGRVTFSHQQNFMRAVRAAFVDIQSNKFSKRIQIDPYLEDVQCCLCYSDKGVYFCRDFQCFNYYCGACWDKQHSYNQLGNHKPLMRKREHGMSTN
jgi:cytoplasmic polyadenylation element-binding protein